MSRGYKHGYNLGMDTVPLRAAKDTLSALLDRVEGTHERVTITRNGHPVAVLISPEDLDALEETLDVLSDADLMAEIRAARDELARGEALDETQLRELVQRRRG
jgi:prevent-host-death family protein